jgi:hypothetical protein
MNFLNFLCLLINVGNNLGGLILRICYTLVTATQPPPPLDVVTESMNDIGKCINSDSFSIHRSFEPLK